MPFDNVEGDFIGVNVDVVFDFLFLCLDFLSMSPDYLIQFPDFIIPFSNSRFPVQYCFILFLDYIFSVFK